jgi:transcriptional regulator with XRE-family HTH domain
MVSEQSVDALRAAVRCLRYRDGGLRDLARRAGVSYSWLTKFATGRTRNEKIDTLRRIARLFPDPLPAPRARSLPAGQDTASAARAGLQAVAPTAPPPGPIWRPR